MHTDRLRITALALLVGSLAWLSTSGSAAAKTLLEDVEPSANTVAIRTDGLACYFCAYGLERFFKKTGRIAAFDMNMKEGIVKAAFVAGQPLVSARQLEQYVHDAGFTARWIEVTFTGRFRRAEQSLVFQVADTGEKLSVREDQEDAVGVADGDLDRLVQIRARGLDSDQAAYELIVKGYEPVDEPAAQRR